MIAQKIGQLNEIKVENKGWSGVQCLDVKEEEMSEDDRDWMNAKLANCGSLPVNFTMWVG